MEKQKCPEIYFKTINGVGREWTSEPIGELIEEITRPVKLEPETKYRLITVKRRNAGISVRSILKGKDILVKSQFKVKFGDYIISKRQVVHGANGLLPKELNNSIVSNEYLVAKGTKKLNIEFFSILSNLPNMYKKFFLSSYGVDIEKLFFDVDDWKKRNISIPSFLEQVKIVKLFQNLDQSIALHEKKLAQTQNFKKAMLEKMFPKAGTKQPTIRLKGFYGDWEAVDLGNICQIGDIDHRMPDSKEQGIPYLMTGDFIGVNELNFKNTKRISDEDYEQLAKKIKPEAGDILFARYASVGTVRLVKTDLKFLISYSCAILKTSVISNGEYVFYYLQTKIAQNQIEQEINTGSQRNIGIDSLKKLSILLPEDNEQNAISAFFRKVDENLLLQQQQLQTLKNLKQAFLEKMFV